ncbi:MAG: hypothetical protein HZC40_15455 [Chloroflexi bacterium]|nr:hypothetical protein [Chloroflexota bacterium]
MRSRKIMIGCGAITLASLMLICASSFGITLALRGGARNAQARQSPASAATPVLGGSPDVIGTLQFFGENTLTVQTAQGARTISITEQTLVRRGTLPGALNDLRPGVALAIWGDSGGARRDVLARVIMIIEQK